MKYLLKAKISFIFLLMVIVIVAFGTYFLTNQLASNKQEISDSSESYSCNPTIKRLEGFNYVKPLLFVDNQSSTTELQSIQHNLKSVIDGFKSNGVLNSASVYLKDYESNDIMIINENEKFKPGSLLKVPELITFLVMNEKKPGLLDQKIAYQHPFSSNKNPKILSKSIQLGQSYTIRELLVYMIQYSDNNATSLLNTIIDVNIFKKLFTDLGLSAPDWNSSDYLITAKEYSLFFRALFNASYLTIQDSEFATQLLAKCNYTDGILKGLPANTKVAHKFGEAGDPTEAQLNESAIVYLKDKPYLLVIMTKGKDLKKLPSVLSQLSYITYQNMLSL